MEGIPSSCFNIVHLWYASDCVGLWISTNYFPILCYFFNSISSTKSWNFTNIFSCSVDSKCKHGISNRLSFNLLKRVYCQLLFFPLVLIKCTSPLTGTCTTVFTFLFLHTILYLPWTKEDCSIFKNDYNISPGVKTQELRVAKSLKNNGICESRIRFQMLL